jgi:hypothetical protein
MELAMVTANITERKRYGFDEDNLQTCTGTAKLNEIDEANAMVCSPSAREE